jgi:lipopolysaccharide transport system ATP-binding protein
MSQAAIFVENLGKRYRIGLREKPPETLGQTLLATARAPFRYLREMSRPPTDAETLWALRDVSFQVAKGEVVGIVGLNGAGKSTLLKILSRITEPTTGRAVINGRVGSLLEIGTGFHPDLTGRENVYLNGTIIGMRRSEINAKFDEIVAFSGIEKFIDTPVKRYSSGMYVRLAFSVASHLEPEIMIMDEVLAVGDVNFRVKSRNKLRSAAQDGRTVLFVSHNMETLASLCPRAIWLEHGRVMADGPTAGVIEGYLSSLAQELAVTDSQYGLTVNSLVLRNAQGKHAHHFYPSEDLTVELNYTAARRIDHPIIWLSVDSQRGPCFAANMFLDGHNSHVVLKGTGTLTCTFKSIPLIPHAYTIRMAIRDADTGQPILSPQEVASFSVIGDLRDYGLPGDLAHAMAPSSVPVILPYEWKFPDGQTASVALNQAQIAASKEW